MKAVTHLEKVIAGEVSAVTHLEQVITEETSPVTYLEKVIAGEAPPVTHLQQVIAGTASPVTHLEHIWAGAEPPTTEQEYTGAVPTTITANGEPLIAYRISGNLVQTGTPTPESPIQPEETGERTGNLFDINATPTKYSQSTTVTIDGRTLTITGAWYIYYEIDVVPNTDYYVDWTVDYAEIQGRGTIAILTTSGQTIKQQDLRPFSFNSGNNQRIRLYIYSGNNEPSTVIISNIMFNTGSTALPYEPYGFKLAIESGGVTTPVYLSEPLRKIGEYADKVEDNTVTRVVKKLVLTGEENGTIYDTSTSRKGIEITGITGIIGGNADIAILAICTHYQAYTRNTLYRNTDNGISNAYQNDKIIFYDASCQTVEAFRQFCAQQYAAGTPVTVWYVLATPTTETITAPTIPTINGEQTFDVDTTLKPSEVYIKYTGR